MKILSVSKNISSFKSLSCAILHKVPHYKYSEYQVWPLRIGYGSPRIIFTELWKQKWSFFKYCLSCSCFLISIVPLLCRWTTIVLTERSDVFSHTSETIEVAMQLSQVVATEVHVVMYMMPATLFMVAQRIVGSPCVSAHN